MFDRQSHNFDQMEKFCILQGKCGDIFSDVVNKSIRTNVSGFQVPCTKNY